MDEQCEDIKWELTKFMEEIEIKDKSSQKWKAECPRDN